MPRTSANPEIITACPYSRDGHKVRFHEHTIGKRVVCPECHKPIILQRGTYEAVIYEDIIDVPTQTIPDPERECPHCFKTVSFPESLIGKIVECPHCKQLLTTMSETGSLFKCKSSGSGLHISPQVKQFGVTAWEQTVETTKNVATIFGTIVVFLGSLSLYLFLSGAAIVLPVAFFFWALHFMGCGK